MRIRKVDRTFNSTVYTQNEIRQWEEELVNIPGKITHEKDSINPHQTELDSLLPEIERVKIPIVSLEAKITGLTSQISIIDNEASIQDNEHNIAQHQAELSRLEPQLRNIQAQIAPIDNAISKLNTYIRIKETQQNYDESSHRMLPHFDAVAILDPQLHSLNRQLHNLNERIHNTQTEISNLEAQQALDSMAHHVHDDHHGGHHGGHHGHHRDSSHHGPGFLHVVSDGLHVVGDVARIMRLSNLRSTLQSMQSERHELHRARDQVDGDLRFHQRECNARKNEIDRAENILRLFDYNDKGYVRTVQLFSLQADLQNRYNEKSPLANEEGRLQSEINPHRVSITKSQQRIHALEDDLRYLRPKAKEYSDNRDQTNLRAQIAQHRETKSPLDQERERLQVLINSHNHAIDAARNAIQTFKNRQKLLNSNRFLMSLRDQPESIFADLAKNIKAQFKAHDEKNPVNQPINVRICLAELDSKINFLRHPEVEGEPGEYKAEGETNAEPVSERTKLYQFCGMLWTMLEQVDVLEGDYDFAERIMSVLRLAPITPQECVNEYRKMQQQYPEQLKTKTQADLEDLELKEYDNACKTLHGALDRLPTQKYKELKPVYDKGKTLTTVIDAERVSLINSTKAKFDFKFATKVIKKTTGLLEKQDEKPDEKYADLARQEDYKKLADHATGSPSLGKKIGGAILMFLGAVVVAGSLLAKFGTFGLAAPLSVGGYILGSGLMVTGFSMFCHGMRKGPSKAIVGFHNAVVKAKISPQLVAAKEPLLRKDDPEIGITDTAGYPGSSEEGVSRRVEPSAPGFGV